MYRYSKFKRGTPLEITERFGNGEVQKTLGYYWQNEASKNRIVLVSTYPPFTLKGHGLFEKRFCDYRLMTKIHQISNSNKGEGETR